jgi:hypothetical protein
VDRVPSKLPNTASRLIAMAASLVGSAHAVMEIMKCSEADFREYCDGRRELPFPELDRLITLIIREQGNIVAGNRQLLSEIRDKLETASSRKVSRALLRGATAVKPQVLAACPPFAYPTLERALGKDLELLPVSTLADAEAMLGRNRDLAMVICGVHFDESRMYELLRYAHSRFPQLPFVCVRILESQLQRISLNAIEIAARMLGAATFIDYPTLAEQRGTRAADQELRQAVLAHRPGATCAGNGGR